MNKLCQNILRILTLFISVSIVINAQSQVPNLISPLNNSTLQKAKNLGLTWEAIPGFSIYRVQYSIDPTFSPPLADYSVSGTKLIISKIDNNKKYYWRVKLTGNDTLWSDIWSFTTTGLPVVPDLILPQHNSRNHADSVLFVWNNQNVNSSYLCQVSTVPEFNFNLMNFTVSDTSINIYPLQLNTNYYFRLKSYNVDFDESSWTTPIHFRTKLTNPELITPLNKSRNLDILQLFSWTETDSTDYYKVQVSTTNLFDKTSTYIDTITTSNSLLIDSLEHNTIYFWRNLSYNSNGDSSDWSAVYEFKTSLTKPNILFPDDDTRNSDTSLTLRWEKTISAENYRIVLAEDLLQTKLLIDTSITEDQLKIDSLSFNRTYYWNVIGFNKEKDSSSWSGIYNFKTRLTKVEAIFPENNAIDISLTPELQWSTVEGGTRYIIQVSDEPDFYYPVVDTVLNRTSFRVNRLIPDSLYYWRILAYNSQKDSSLWSQNYKFRTQPALLFSYDSLKKTINLSESFSDTVGFISIRNSGVNSFIMDSVYVEPDSAFILMNNELEVKPGSANNYLIRINTEKIKAGSNDYKFIYFRRNIQNERDTIETNLNLLLTRATARFSTDTILFNRTFALDSTMKSLFIKNINSNINLRIKKAYISGGDSLSFRIWNPPTTISSNDSLPVNIWFGPLIQNLNSSFLHIETNSHPVRNFSFLLKGEGRGGELAEETYNSVKAIAADSFETFTYNSKSIFFRNSGNEPLNISIGSKRNYFKTENDFQSNIQLNAGDTITVRLKYITPNFGKQNTDTLLITFRGFGNDTITAVLKGVFDSTGSSQMVSQNLRINSENFITKAKIVEENSPMIFTINPKLFSGTKNLEFRMKYYKGGNGSSVIITNDGNYNYPIPRNDISENGIILWGELIVKNNNKITDSIIVLPKTDYQVILSKYKTVDISVPKSTPAEKEELAKVKWVMFGFPADEVIADSVFKYFGGISKMKDGEWIIYNYTSETQDSFPVFNSYSFQSNRAYFMAQALLDTFKISYEYMNNIATRKLSDNEIMLSGNGWKTISNPYLFDVEVDSSITLQKYDLNYQSYRTTNIMKPGEGYFIEPAVSRLKLKTYGKYNPLIYPKILADIGWHLKVTASGEFNANEIFVSILNAETKKLSKSALRLEQKVPPIFVSGLNFYIRNGNDEKLNMSVKEGSEGAVWDLILISDNDQYVNIAADVNSSLPKGFSFKIYDENYSVITNQKILLHKTREQLYKLIIGTEEYINRIVKNLNDLPDKFYLSQNYPNPFNPSTSIDYNIPAFTGNFVHVQLKVYDILGREVLKLVDEKQSAGKYTVTFNAQFSSGIYIYKLTAGNYSVSKKLLLLK